MDNSLDLIDNETLGLFDNEGNVLFRHKPLWTEFTQFKRVKESCNIVKEADDDFPKNIDNKANIYCLDDNFKLKWTIEAPFENDSFPNQIIWDKKIERLQAPSGHLILETTENTDTFTCSSWKGITVTVDYETGKIISSEFTK